MARLHEQVKIQAEAIAIYQEQISLLEVYLSLPKFHEDTTVQVADIFLRLNEMKHAANGCLIQLN